MSARYMDARSRMVAQYKESVRESAAVVIAALAVLIAVGAILFAGIALYAAADTRQDMEQLENEVRLSELYVQDLAMDEFIELTSTFARKYVRWKKRHLFPDSDLDA